MNMSVKQEQTHRYKERLFATGKGSQGGMDWEFGISKCKLAHIGWINNEVLPYSIGNYIQYLSEP